MTRAGTGLGKSSITITK